MLTADLLGFPISLMPLVALFIGPGITLIGLTWCFSNGTAQRPDTLDFRVQILWDEQRGSADFLHPVQRETGLFLPRLLQHKDRREVRPLPVTLPERREEMAPSEAERPLPSRELRDG